MCCGFGNCNIFWIWKYLTLKVYPRKGNLRFEEGSRCKASCQKGRRQGGNRPIYFLLKFKPYFECIHGWPLQHFYPLPWLK